MDEQQVITKERVEHRTEPYFGLEMLASFSLFTYDTSAAFKEIYFRQL